MIELSKDEALHLLKIFSRIEGFLLGLESAKICNIEAEFEYPVNLLTKKLGGKND
jgi:hypothetical protein